MAEALGEALLYLRTDDQGLDRGIANAKGKSEGLGRTFDDTSGKATNLGRAIDGAGASAARFGSEQAKVTAVSGAQRAGMQQLSMQISDVATMYSLGARPMQIFASQIGQITQAVQLASGGTSRFAAIMGSPWTMAISTAAIVLVPLIDNLLDSEDAADKAGRANETLADKLDRTKNSYAEVVAAVREYNAEQKKATETTLQNAGAVAAAAAANLKEALSIRQKLAAQLAADTAAARNSAGQGTGGAAGSFIGGRADVTRALLAENEAEIARLTKDAQEAVGNVAAELAKLDSDSTKRIAFNAEQRRKAVLAEVGTLEQKRAKLAQINREERSALDAAAKERRASNATTSPSASRAASVGDMVALLKSLFGAGTQITSTTGGKHTKGSDHYAGRAIDFIPEGGMGRYSSAEVQKMLEDAGVTIRRNKNGTQQLFGPGRSASKPGDHDDHFHLAWSGSASPEEAQRRAAEAAARAAREAEREARRVERYNRDLAGLQEEARDLQLQLTGTAEERHRLEREGLEIAIAEQRRRIETSTEYTDAEKANLLLALEKKAALERELLENRRKEELARQEMEIAQAMRANERELLQADLRLADSRKDRRAIELRLLDLTYEQERAALEAVIASRDASDAQKRIAEARLALLGRLKAGDREALDREYESPLDRYRRDVADIGNGINDEMERIAVNGLDDLNDRLADVIVNAKSVAGAFKEVANQIIAELARIAIQQAIIGPLLDILGSAFGGGSGGKLSNVVSTPKGSFKNAGMFADGGLIPTGSFGIVGEAGPEPIFATAGGVGVLPNSALRSMSKEWGSGGGTHVTVPINIDATGADPAALGRVQASIDRLRAELPGTIVSTVQDAGDRRLISARKWQ